MKPPVKYQGMSPECETLLTFALNDEAEKPVALDDACDLLAQLRCRTRTKFVETFGSKVPVNMDVIRQYREKFTTIFGKKIVLNMEDESDYEQFLNRLTDEVNMMETELDNQCPWLISILGIDWVKGFQDRLMFEENGRAVCETATIGWEGVRTQPLSEDEKKIISAKWGKVDPERLAKQDAESEVDEEDTPVTSEDNEEIVLEEVSVSSNED